MAAVEADDVRALAEEQAALRRVATLVARGAASDDVFAAVTVEIARLLGVDFADIGRYDPDGTAVVVGAWGKAIDRFTVGTRWPLGGNNLSTIVARTGRSARMDSYADASGPIGLASRETGVRSAVATPIVVDGHLWGVMAADSTLPRPLPADTEARLASFTELVATAIANAASGAALARLANEQAALRRVATLVARGVPEAALFAVVTDEVAQLLGVDSAAMGRYGSDATMTAVAISSGVRDTFPEGRRWPLVGRNVRTLVFETGRPARIDSYADAEDELGVVLRQHGFRSAAGAPIVVNGRLWGLMYASSRREAPLPADTEERLASFTDLVATAIANAQSRAGVARLVEEQAALRRVATLVAQGVPSEQLFAAVVREAGQLLAVDLTSMTRYEADGTLTVVAAWGDVAEGGVAPGDAAEGGVRSSVARPVTVDGRVWGVLTAGSIREQPLQIDIEARLGSFTELVATAIANADSRASLLASRARIVAAADQSRRTIERDLHDGAQQRLVHAVIVLKLALRALSSGDPNASTLLAEALAHAQQATSELRELAHGILPSVLTRGGLSAGVDALVSRASLPVGVDVSVGRLPAGVEASAYFVVSEALTNVVKHARAGSAEVLARVDGDELRVEVSDNGVGGARAGEGTGLSSLADRVSALGGRLTVESPPGGGTRVRAQLPLAKLSSFYEVALER
jgi:signal transduction histidine kinase/putative methionine-R-sulfoxide reductase with GAF domain